MEGNSGITIIEYIGYNNPRKLNALLMQKGFSPSTQLDELIYKASDLLNEEPECSSDLLELHPDREEIINDYLQKNPQPKTLGIKSESTSGCDGKCSCKHDDLTVGKFVDGNWVEQKKSNATGADNSKYILLGFGVVAVFALYKIMA